MCVIHLASGTDFLTLRVHGRTKADAQDYWDANWLHCTVEASAGAFRGTVEWQLRNEDLSQFMHGLESLDVRAGEAVLDTGDGWLDVRVIRNEDGDVEARCQLVDKPADGNALEFRLSLNKAVPAALVGQLREVLERFPVIGGQEGKKQQRVGNRLRT